MSVRDNIKVVLFCGGRGSATITRALLRHTEIELSLIVNAYDDGQSTGTLRSFIPGMLGPSDFRKNLTYLLGNYSHAQYALKSLMEYRLPDSVQAEDVAKLASYTRTGRTESLWIPLSNWFGQLSEPLQKDVRRLLAKFFDHAGGGSVAFDYRGCSLGNLVFAGAYLNCACDFNAAAAEVGSLVGARAHLLNVSEEQNRILVGLKQDGSLLSCEAEIVGPQSSQPIVGLYLLESPLTKDEIKTLEGFDVKGRQSYLEGRDSVPPLSSSAARALAQADVILYGPGTQHSSLLPSYRIAASALASSPAALKALVVNLDSDNDIQGLSASDLVDRVLDYGAALTHIVLSEDGKLAPGGLSGDSYRGAKILRACFATPHRQAVHNGTLLVEKLLSARYREERLVCAIDIFVDIHNRSVASDEIVEEFLEANWGGRPAHLILNHSESVCEKGLPVRAESHAGVFPELEYFRKWLKNGDSEYLVMMTGDGGYAFADVQNIIALLDQNTALGGVFGSRTQSRRQFITSIQAAYGEHRLLYRIAKLAAFFVSILLYARTGVIFSDPLTGLRVFRRESLGSVPVNCRAPLSIVRYLIGHGVEIAELPVRYRTFSGFTDPFWRMRRGLRNALSLLSLK